MDEMVMERKYFDPKLPGAYSGRDKFYRSLKGKSRKEVNKFLKKQRAYTLHFPVRHRIRRNRVVVGGMNHLWDVDLASFVNEVEFNDGFAYVMLAVDVVSKFCHASKLKTKQTREVSQAMVDMVQRAALVDKKPLSIRTDRGEYTRCRLVLTTIQ